MHVKMHGSTLKSMRISRIFLPSTPALVYISGNAQIRSFIQSGLLTAIERTLNLVRTTLYAQNIFSMEDLLVSVTYQLYILKGLIMKSEAVKRKSPAKSHPIPEKPLKKQIWYIRKSPIPIKTRSRSGLKTHN